MIRIPRARILGVALLSFAVAGCEWLTGPDGDERPLQTGDGWETATLEDVGMDREPLRQLVDLIDRTADHLMHSVLIVRDGKLVFEQYWPGVDLDPVTLNPVTRDFDRETLHYVASVSKSLTSVMVGIALDQGLFGGVQDSLFAFFPEYAALRTDQNAGITLEHLLAFSSGYAWNEFEYGFDDPRDSHHQMFGATDPVAYLLGRPLVAEPGAAFLYNSGDTNILGEIVRRLSGSPTLVAFAAQHLFAPLGIEQYSWVRFPLAPEVTFASGGASLRPRDMAKLGALYLNQGVWHGTRIVSSAWVDASTAVTTPLPGYVTVHGYGYNWWLGRSRHGGREIEYFRAAGWGGQDVFVYPELDLVLVFTAGAYYDERPLPLGDLIEAYVLAAIPSPSADHGEVSAGPLPGSPSGADGRFWVPSLHLYEPRAGILSFFVDGPRLGMIWGAPSSRRFTP